MEYFFVKVDKRLRHLPEIGFPREPVGAIKTVSGTTQTNGNLIVHVKANNGIKTEYSDYFVAPCFMIAEKFHTIFEKYQKNISFRRVMLIEKEEQKPYFLFVPPVIECEDKKDTIYETDGSIKSLVLDKEKVGTNRIFSVEGMKKSLIVRLDVAESILRREPNGIWFEPVRTTEGGEE